MKRIYSAIEAPQGDAVQNTQTCARGLKVTLKDCRVGDAVRRYWCRVVRGGT